MITRLTAIIIAAAFFSGAAYARIGESRSSFENRLMSKSDGGYQYENKEDRLREIFELPYRNLLLLFPKDTSNSFYFKKPGISLATKSDVVRQAELEGWEVHVCFFKEISVMEFYRRRGSKITPEEIAGLLEMTQNAMKKGKDEKPAEWQKRTPKKADIPKPQIEVSENFSKAVALLPRITTRMVNMKVPDEIKSSINFDTSSASLILTEEKRRFALRNKDKLAAEQAAEEAKRKENAKSRKSSTVRERSAALAKAKEADTKSEEVSYGGISDNDLEDRLMILQKIPDDEGTAFGYTLNLSDDSIRALLMPDGVLFIDSRFDKLLRDEMERLWLKQETERQKAYKDSLYRF